jgi:hypothetical protein
VRKAIYALINNIVVNTKTFPCYDYRATKNITAQTYILMSTQTALFNNGTKCGHGWDSSILLDVVTKFKGAGNTGSRLLADDAADAIIQALDGFTLDVSSGLVISQIRFSAEPDIVDVTSTENVIRKLIRYEITIN